MNDIQKHLNRTLSVLLALIALFITTGIYLYTFHENPAAVITNSPMPTDRAVYRIGDTIFFTVEYCRYTHAPTTTYISFSNDLIFDLPPRTFTGASPGCGTVKGGVVVIPAGLPPGRYFLVGKNEYRVNFLATRYTDWYTTEFEVMK